MLKKAKQEKQKAFFNFDKLIINGQIYRGKETKTFPIIVKGQKLLMQLLILSLNVRGISNFHKQRTMFTWCRKRKADVIFL